MSERKRRMDVYNLVNLQDKKIIVAGASSGIGKAIAILLSKLEAKVILVARREDKLQEVIAEMEGDGHKYYCFDLSEVDDIEGFVKNIVIENGTLDGLVYCAGVGANRPLKLLKPFAMQEAMQINTLAFVEIVRSVTKKNAYNTGMSIVGISSVSSMRGNKSKVAYCASKGALDSMVRAMAKELSVKKIRINTVNPGFVKTPHFNKLEQNAGSDSEDFNSILQRQYLGLAEPEDIANSVVFLLSDAAKIISGTNLVVDGGLSSSI